MNQHPPADAPLRVCLISYRSNPHSGGQGVYVRYLSRALRELGHAVDVLAGPPDPMLDPSVRLIPLPCLDLYNPEDLFRTPGLHELRDPVNLLEWIGVSTMGFPEPFTFGLRAYRYLRRRYHDYDVVHDNQSLSYGVWAIQRLLPTVATIHHPITVDRKIDIRTAGVLWKKMKQMRWYSFIGMQKQVARTIGRIITVSQSAAGDIHRDFNIPTRRFRVVPNGIDTQVFRPLPDVARDPERIIVTNSADTPLKGLYHLLHAVHAISRKRSIHLRVIGSPKKDGGVEKTIRRLDIGHLIRFTGRVDNEEFIRQYARASVAVVPSLYEGFGLPAGEAMACGVPVVSTTGGALPEVVGDAGVLVPPADDEALAHAIVDLLDHPEYAKTLGVAGYKRVHAHFTWRRAAELTVAAYREAILDNR